MKKLFFALLFAGMSQFATAQDATLKKDVMKVIQASGADSQMQMAKEEILKMIPEAKKAAFLKDFEATLPSLYDKMANVYMETYTKEDIKAMLAYYESPVGKKISSKSAEVTKKSMDAAMEWSQSLQDMVMKYMQ